MAIATTYSTRTQILHPCISQAVQSNIGPQMGLNHPLRILIAESSPICRAVMLRIFGRLSYTASIATPQNILTTVQESVYDLILIGQHYINTNPHLIPAIRQQFPLHQQPTVVALASQSTYQQAQQLADDGIDTTLCKPLRLSTVVNILQKCTPISRPMSLIEIAHPVDLSNVYEIVGDDNPTLLTELITLFLNDATRYIHQLRLGLGHDNFKTLERTAHSLKGASRCIGADQLAVLCSHLEHELETHIIDNNSQLLAQIEVEFKHVQQFLQTQIMMA